MLMCDHFTLEHVFECLMSTALLELYSAGTFVSSRYVHATILYQCVLVFVHA